MLDHVQYHCWKDHRSALFKSVSTAFRNFLTGTLEHPCSVILTTDRMRPHRLVMTTHDWLDSEPVSILRLSSTCRNAQPILNQVSVLGFIAPLTVTGGLRPTSVLGLWLRGLAYCGAFAIFIMLRIDTQLLGSRVGPARIALPPRSAAWIGYQFHLRSQQSSWEFGRTLSRLRWASSPRAPGFLALPNGRQPGRPMIMVTENLPMCLSEECEVNDDWNLCFSIIQHYSRQLGSRQ